MLFRKALLILVVATSASAMVYGQSDEFCRAVSAITRDAPNQFRNVRGNALNAGLNAFIWASSIKVPGTINSRFVGSSGLFYEGALFQSKNKDEVAPAYDKYKSMLNECLSAKGYKMANHPNFYQGMTAYKKLVFMQEIDPGTKQVSPPPHITMEVTYNKDMSLYTIVFYIFEH